MDDQIQNNRTTDAETVCFFPDRWSPRAFTNEIIPHHQLESLFEAARWAPSSMNDQPWLFLYAVKPHDKKLFLSLLNERNQEWAKNAPVLMFLIAKKAFEQSGKINRHSFFDCGAAWMSLAIQARFLGLYAHAMGGFNREKAFESLNIDPDKYDITIAIALGRRGSKNNLSAYHLEQEKPSQRKPLNDIFHEGAFRIL